MDPVWIVATLMDCVQHGLHKARIAHDLHGHLEDVRWPLSRPTLEVGILGEWVVINLHAGYLAVYAYVPKTTESGKVEE